MSRLMAAIYDRVMAGTEQACLATWRAELLGGVRGHVLEVGAGTGANLDHYGDGVERLCLAEPDDGMRWRLQNKARRFPRLRCEIAEHTMEAIPHADATFDAVVCTLVLCSVHDPARALAEVYRVLKPTGELLFLEHVAAEPGTSRRRWQHRIDPVWHRMVGNCHITRDTAQSIEAAGLTFRSIERQSMRKALPWVRPCIRGVAGKAEPHT